MAVRQIEAKEILGWIEQSVANSKKITRSPLMLEKYPEQVESARFAATMGQNVINSIRSGVEPKTKVGAIWKEWFIRWACGMVVYYNREGCSTDGLTPSVFSQYQEWIRKERDDKLVFAKNDKHRKRSVHDNTE